MGSPAQYEISGGRIVTTLQMTPFEVTVYKLGDKYVAARSNEFGYANYEVEEVQVMKCVAIEEDQGIADPVLAHSSLEAPATLTREFAVRCGPSGGCASRSHTSSSSGSRCSYLTAS